MNPLITMSAVVGAPTRDTVHEYMASLKEGSIEQALIYPRSGCEIEYLSEKWFEVVGYFIDSAKALGMGIWLYDDFNWPSGDAGGRVTAIPEYRLKAICTRGEDAGRINVKSRHNSGLFGEKYFPDLLSHDAVDFFIKSTHEEYYKRFGADFGTVIKGLFSDEPSIGYSAHGDYIPYYDGMKNDYFERFGGSFDSDMLSSAEGFYQNAMTLLSDRFRACYVEKIATWCRERGILMTGHLMCDHNLFYGIKHSGDVLENLCALSLPGIDEIYTDFEDESEMLLFGVAEYAGRKSGAMAELFALGPCDMSYEKKRAMLYLSACHKIDRYFLAISHMDMRGNLLVKDYFNNFSIDQPDFIAMKELAKEAEACALLAKNDFTPDVYIKNPFSELSRGALSDGVDARALADLINELTYNQIQWKFTNDDVENAPVISLDRSLEFVLDNHTLEPSKIEHKITVTTKNGDTPRGIFVRRFDNGKTVVINLFAPEAEYLVDKRPVFIRKYGVYFLGEEQSAEARTELSPTFEVSYLNDNIIRTMHLNERAEIYAERDLCLSVAVRNGASVKLDGAELPLKSSVDALPRGMRCLYSQTEPFVLKRGKHELLATDDFKYMPSAVLIGDFCAESASSEVCRLSLKPRRRTYRCGEELLDYHTVELTARIFIPHGATRIELEGTSLYTQAYVDGKMLEKDKNDTAFRLFSDTWGRETDLRVVQRSSLAPIFGDVDFWDKSVKECAWRGTPSTEQKPFGISRVIISTKR